MIQVKALPYFVLTSEEWEVIYRTVNNSREVCCWWIFLTVTINQDLVANIYLKEAVRWEEIRQIRQSTAFLL